jgi:hypothetical protein
MGVMTIHYHGTPITPAATLLKLRGRHFCVSYMRPDNIEWCDANAQTLMLDNGAFSKWKSGKETDWPGYYVWCDRWLDRPTTWAIIPDEIVEGSQAQDALIAEWPFGQRGVPVFHIDEPTERALRLLDEWPVVAFGATGEYAAIPAEAFVARMDELWREIGKRHPRTPNVHMLRGMQLSGWHWPFASVDSTDLGQNHHRLKRHGDHYGWALEQKADRWDAMQCPARFIDPTRPELELFEEVA